ncbi:unannotated protein [freshwater metagenome]|uniref:Unannotated protein n=1 Tax=freshwater metagenome TaxID=449393 RepID=A0A6J7KKD6_9ZZZZ
MLAHLAWSGCAVEADHVDAERLECGERRPDLGAEEHGPGRLDGDLGDDRQVGAGCRQRPAGAEERCLRLEEVLGGLDEDCIDASLDHARDLDLVGIAQVGERCVAERGQFRPGADRSEHPSRVLRRVPGVGRRAGDDGAGACELEDAVLDVVLGKVREVRAEGVRLDAVDADLEVGIVHGRDDVGPRDVEDLVAALVPLEVVEGGVGGLEHRAHRSVGNDDAGGKCRAERGVLGAHSDRSLPRALPAARSRDSVTCVTWREQCGPGSAHASRGGTR